MYRMSVAGMLLCLLYTLVEVIKEDYVMGTKWILNFEHCKMYFWEKAYMNTSVIKEIIELYKR